MAPEQKDDIVCCFHVDLENRLDRIEKKIDGVQSSMNEMLLWRAGVKGAASIIAFVVSAIVSVAILAIKSAMFGGGK